MKMTELSLAELELVNGGASGGRNDKKEAPDDEQSVRGKVTRTSKAAPKTPFGPDMIRRMLESTPPSEKPIPTVTA